MVFNKVAIVGLGLIGGSLAGALKKKRVINTVIGIDHQPVIEKALAGNLISQGYPPEEINRGLKDADLIFLATPIKVILELLPQIAQVVKPGTLITDVGSTKEAIVMAATRYLPKDVYFLGGHPMTGSEKQGLAHADPFLFEHTIYTLTETHLVPEGVVNKLVEMIEAIGASVIVLPAKLHDEIVAVVSHLPQLIAVTLMNCVSQMNQKNDLYLRLAAGGFRDITRVASSPYEIWSDICRTNEKNIKAAIDQFITELQSIKESLSDPKLEFIFNDAAQTRELLSKDEIN